MLQSSFCRSLVISGVAALLFTAGPAGASGCVKYSGLEHCALGEGTVQVVDDVLQVSDIGPDGGDGVAVTLPEATVWQADVELSGGDTSPRLALGALVGDEEISRAEIVTGDDGAHLSALFTGSDGPRTYSVLVYNGGTLVGSQGGVGAGAGDYVNVNTLPYIVHTDPWLHGYYGFQTRVANGACVWTFEFPSVLRFTMSDDVELDGDEIHLVEEVGDGDGHYPYVAFDSITLRSTRDLQIDSETAD